MVCDPVIEGFGCRVGGEAQDLAARDSSEACGAVDEEEAQRLHAGDSVAIGALARARFGSSQSRMQLKATHQVMREDGELEPGAVGPVVIGGHHVEGKLALEFGEGLFLRAAAGGEGPQGLRGKREIGRHRGVFEVTVVGGEQIELVILRAPMMNPLAIDHAPATPVPRPPAQAGSRSNRYQQ